MVYRKKKTNIKARVVVMVTIICKNNIRLVVLAAVVSVPVVTVAAAVADLASAVPEIVTTVAVTVAAA